MTKTLPELSLETRRRLLEAAGEVFAEKGFRDATVREICRRGKSNIAAVNYHFKDKKRLYTSVLRYAHSCAKEAFPPVGNLTDSLEDRLRNFIMQFLRRMLDPGRPSWHGRLMGREMAEPTSALALVVEHEIMPQVKMLEDIVREMMPGVSPAIAGRCAMSVVGQILHYHFARPVLKRINPVYANIDSQIDALADHIMNFSLGGIQAISAKQNKKMKAGKSS
jgi:TetR/AcrR family transcriptional regulator, regulator of cefoperazone and chloramphenicol sensitivity